MRGPLSERRRPVPVPEPGEAAKADTAYRDPGWTADHHHRRTPRPHRQAIDANNRDN